MNKQAHPGEDWELFLDKILPLATERQWKGHIIDVADTMDACRRWFESYGVPFTAADLLGMAKLILDREAAAMNDRRPLD